LALPTDVSTYVTITHPLHPLRGQRVALVRIRRGVSKASTDLIVRLPDGTHAAIAISSTDYDPAQTIVSIAGSAPLLLEPQALHDLALLVEKLLAKSESASKSLSKYKRAGKDTPS
jgi:hypothetical protein